MSIQGLGLRCSALLAGPDSKQGIAGGRQANEEHFPTKLKCISELQEQREQAVCAEGGGL